MNDLTRVKSNIYDIRELVSIIESYGFKFSNVSIFNFFNRCGIKPCKIELLPNGRQRYYYDRRALVLLALHLRKRLRRGVKYVYCIDCHQQFLPQELTNHFCPRCHSIRYVEKYCYDGWKDEGHFNTARARLLLKAIVQLLRSHR